MYASNVRGIEKTLKENNALITISANKKNVFSLKCCTENDVNVYTGYSLKNVLIKASKFLPESKEETQICVMGNSEANGAIEYTLKNFGFKMIIFKCENMYYVEVYKKDDKKKEMPIVIHQSTFKDGLNFALNELEADFQDRLVKFKMAHPKEFGIED